MRWLIDGDSLDPGEDTFAIPHRDRRLQRLFLEPFSKVGFADGGNDRLLVGTVPIDLPHRDDGCNGDLGHPGLMESAFDEEIAGRGQCMQSGRASCRERVCQYVWSLGLA